MNLNDLKLGHSWETDEYYVGFGNNDLTREKLNELFPDVQFAFVHQVHSDRYVEANPDNSNEQADALFTQKVNLAPTVKTADCIPLVIVSETKIAAIHAGWKGIEKNIIGNTLQEFEGQTCAVFIGPHIQANSFEVGVDVAQRLEAAYKKVNGKGTALLEHVNSNKNYINLKKIATQQLDHAPVKFIKFFGVNVDTFVDKAYPSYRRDRSKERIFSFGYLKCQPKD